MSFSWDYLWRAMQKQYLTANDDGTRTKFFLYHLIVCANTPLTVLVLDVRAWISGARSKEELDWDRILPQAPILKNQEIPLGSMVGVVHNIGHWGVTNNWNVSLNIFAVILLATGN